MVGIATKNPSDVRAWICFLKGVKWPNAWRRDVPRASHSTIPEQLWQWENDRKKPHVHVNVYASQCTQQWQTCVIASFKFVDSILSAAVDWTALMFHKCQSDCWTSLATNHRIINHYGPSFHRSFMTINFFSQCFERSSNPRIFSWTCPSVCWAHPQISDGFSMTGGWPYVTPVVTCPNGDQATHPITCWISAMSTWKHPKRTWTGLGITREPTKNGHGMSWFTRVNL